MPAPPVPRAKPAKVRYFKGKPGGAVADSDSDSGEDETLPLRTTKQVVDDPSLVAGGAGRIVRPETLKDVKPKIKMELGSVQIPDGGVSRAIGEGSDEESEGESEEDDVKPKFVPKMEDSSEYETDSEEESEEEAKPAFRPVFVGKGARKTVTAEMVAKEAEEAEKREEEEREQRKLDSKELAGETIRRELAEKEVSSDLIPDVDDTDGLDPEAEFDAWRARELARLLRETKAQAEADEEREEIERRRAMPEDQRMAEDMAYADGTRNGDKTEMGFLQKYYHKGAFHQDDDSEIFRRDYTGATESQVDMSSLPAVMQVRNYGKKSRSKYTHLTDQDTSSGGWGTAHQAFGRPSDASSQQQGCWNCGGPHSRADCPNGSMQDANVIDGVKIGGSASLLGAPQSYGGGFGGNRGGGAGPTSANTAALGSGSGSRWGQDRSGSGDKGRDDRDHDRDRRSHYDDRDRRDDRRSGGRDRERSRSPRRRDDDRRHDRDRDRSDRSDRDSRDDRDRSDRRVRDRGERDRDHGRDRHDRSRDRDHDGHRRRDRR